jgi:hypothetical protein
MDWALRASGRTSSLAVFAGRMISPRGRMVQKLLGRLVLKHCVLGTSTTAVEQTVCARDWHGRPKRAKRFT